MATHNASNETTESPTRGGLQETRGIQEGQAATPSEQPTRQGCLQDSRSIEAKEKPKTTEGPVRGS